MFILISTQAVNKIIVRETKTGDYFLSIKIAAVLQNENSNFTD